MNQNEIVTWSPDRFDRGYYEEGARGGFNGYRYNDPIQQQQLALKFAVAGGLGPYRSALFVGCAKGFEVRYWLEHGLEAWGVDVSEYAIQNAEPQVKDRLIRYDGWNLNAFKADRIDVVLAWDVLTLVPEPVRQKLIGEMIRVAAKGIVFRTIVKNWRNSANEIDGSDGVHFRYETIEYWDRAFTESGKFKLKHMGMHYQYECTFLYERV